MSKSIDGAPKRGTRETDSPIWSGKRGGGLFSIFLWEVVDAVVCQWYGVRISGPLTPQSFSFSLPRAPYPWPRKWFPVGQVATRPPGSTVVILRLAFGRRVLRNQFPDSQVVRRMNRESSRLGDKRQTQLGTATVKVAAVPVLDVPSFLDIQGQSGPVPAACRCWRQTEWPKMVKRKGPGIKIGFCDRYDVGADWRRSSCSLDAPPPHGQLLENSPMLCGSWLPFFRPSPRSTGRRERGGGEFRNSAMNGPVLPSFG